MEPDAQKQPAYEDEINLFDYWTVIVKKKKFIIGIVLISMISTAVINLIMPKIYRGEAIITVDKDLVTPDKIINLAENNKEMVFWRNRNLVESLVMKDVKSSGDKLMIIVEVKGANHIKDAISEFADSVRNLFSFKGKIEQKLQNMKVQIKQLSFLMKDNDEFISDYKKLMKEKKISSLPFNVVDLRQKTIDMEMQQLSLEHDLRNYKDIEVGPVNISDKPVRPKVIRNVVVAGILGLLLGTLLVLIVSHMKRVRKDG